AVPVVPAAPGQVRPRHGTQIERLAGCAGQRDHAEADGVAAARHASEATLFECLHETRRRRLVDFQVVGDFRESPRCSRAELDGFEGAVDGYGHGAAPSTRVAAADHWAMETPIASHMCSTGGRGATSATVPGRVLATKCPSVSLASSDSPRNAPASQPAAKASPAPTESTTAARRAGTVTRCPPRTVVASSAPFLTTSTHDGGRREASSSTLCTFHSAPASSSPTKTTSA